MLATKIVIVINAMCHIYGDNDDEDDYDDMKTIMIVTMLSILVKVR
jgi:hypothetical protein